MTTVRLHSLDADEELLADGAVAQTAHEQVKDFALAHREGRQRSTPAVVPNGFDPGRRQPGGQISVCRLRGDRGRARARPSSRAVTHAACRACAFGMRHADVDRRGGKAKKLKGNASRWRAT